MSDETKAMVDRLARWALVAMLMLAAFAWSCVTQWCWEARAPASGVTAATLGCMCLLAIGPVASSAMNRSGLDV